MRFAPLWAMVGACIGSFLSVVLHRLPLIEEKQISGVPPLLTLANPPSTCPCCSTRIHWRHNLPIFGYLWLRGKTACCNQPYSPVYLVLELIASGVGLFCLTAFSPNTTEVALTSMLGWLVLGGISIVVKSGALPFAFSGLGIGIGGLYHGYLYGALNSKNILFGIFAVGALAGC